MPTTISRAGLDRRFQPSPALPTIRTEAEPLAQSAVRERFWRVVRLDRSGRQGRVAPGELADDPPR